MAPIAATDSSATGRVLSVRQSLFAMLGLCFVVMMVAIDQTVVGMALPTIVAELNGFELYAWVGTSYLLTSVIMVPIFGRLGDYYGRRHFVIAAIVVFGAASVLCGFSNSMMQLVLARALQGIGGGMLVGTAFACIPDLFPEPRVRLRWQVLFSSAYGLANAIGPTLGGVLTHYAGWRSVFFVNLPISILGLWFVSKYLPRIRHMQHGNIHLDWQGAILIAAGLSGLQLFVEFLPTPHMGTMAALAGAGSVVMFAALYFWERHCVDPLLPLDMFRNKSLSALFGLSTLLGFAMFAILFYVPLLLQGGFGQTPQAAGVLITPLVFCITVASVFNSRILVRLPNPNIMLYVGFVLLFISCAGLALISRSTGVWVMAGVLVVGGLGLGFVVPNLTVFGQEIAGRGQLGIATALLQSTRMIGGMLGMAIVGSLVNHYYVQHVKLAVSAHSPGAWAGMLEDPQILMNAADQQKFTGLLHGLGLDGAALIDAARASMVSSIHLGMVLVLLVVVAASFWVRGVEPVRFNRASGGAKPAAGPAAGTEVVAESSAPSPGGDRQEAR